MGRYLEGVGYLVKRDASPIVKLSFLFIRPPPLAIYLPRLQVLALVGFQLMVAPTRHAHALDWLLIWRNHSSVLKTISPFYNARIEH